MPTKIYYNRDFSEIDVVILAGGQGSRLREVVKDRPKSMAEINGRPLLDILIDYISNFGFRRFILSIGHMAEVIENYYKNGNPHEIIFSREESPLGTGGAVKRAEKFIRSESFLVLNGDSFCPFNLNEFYDFHLLKQALCSMALIESENVENGGNVVVDGSSKIIEFNEKTKKNNGLLNAGIYFFDRKVLAHIPPETKHSLECDLFPKLAGNEFYGHLTKEKMIDIGTPERYLKAQQLLKKYEGTN